jgi:hypothetical protein
MKTLTLFTMAAALAAVATSDLNAAEPFLSPRVNENWIRTVPGVTEDRLDRRNLFKHRVDLVAHPRVAGLSNDRDLVRTSRGITASPRALATFPWLAKPQERTGAMIAQSRR